MAEVVGADGDANAGIREGGFPDVFAEPGAGDVSVGCQGAAAGGAAGALVAGAAAGVGGAAAAGSLFGGAGAGAAAAPSSLIVQTTVLMPTVVPS